MLCIELKNTVCPFQWCITHYCNFNTYRRLSLSQSPGDQTKYFEISVVWDSQSVTSFTFLYPPQNGVLGGVYCFQHVRNSVIPSYQHLRFLYPATQKVRGIMLYPPNFECPSVCPLSVCLSVRPSAFRFRALTWVPFDLFSSNFA